MNQAIEVSQLCKSYPSFELHNVGFSLPQGCIMGLIGENGAGKTTTLKALLNLIKPEKGEIRLLGLPLKGQETKIKEQVGVVWENSFFYESFNAQEVESVLSKAYQQWDSALYRRLLDRFCLPPKQSLKQYSKGMRMQLMIACALAHHPKLLVLDEATSGLDPVMRNEILDLFLEFIQQETHSILFSSHITSDLDKIADYITFLHKGRVLFTEEKDTLYERYRVLRCSETTLHTIDPAQVVRVLRHEFYCQALVTDPDSLHLQEPSAVEPATLEQIMLFFIKGEGLQ